MDLILLHGVGLDHTIWLPLRVALPDVSTHAYDLRGHGEGPNWEGPASLDGFVADLMGYADGQGLDKFALCGFSLGVMIAQWAALTNPARISHLILLNGVYDRTPEQMSAVQTRFRQSQTGGPQVMIDAALARWFTPEFAVKHPEYLAQTRRCLETNDTDQFMRSYRVFAHEGAQITGRLKSIKVPALVVTGGLDAGSTPAMAEKMAAELPNAHCAIFKDAAHMVPMQKPAELAGLIMDLLAKETR